MQGNYYNIHTHHINEEKLTSSDIISICNCTYLQKKNISISKRNLYFSAGIHPWDIQADTSNIQLHLDWIEDALNNNVKVVAIGECGLDNSIKTSISEQTQIFQQQIDISENTNTPVIIHCVKAWTELLKIRKDRKIQNPWIIHGFRGNKDLMLQLLNAGIFISFGQFYNETSITHIPLDKLFLETDISTTHITDIYADIAKKLKISIESLQNQINQNVSIFAFN